MPRAQRKLTDKFPYHISARCINRDWFKIPKEDVWIVFSNYLYFVKHAFNLNILSFVLMDNHFHLLLQTPNSNISAAMNYLMREVSKELTRMSGRINQTWGAPYHASLITTNHHYLHTYKYVYRNPVEAQLCERVEDYPFSTLYGLLGKSNLVIPVSEDLTLFSDSEETIRWLNRDYKNDSKLKIKSALKKTEFSFEKKYSYLDDLETNMS